MFDEARRGPTSPARFYEDYFVPTMFRPFTHALVARANPQPGARVLDVACGTGIVTRVIGEHLNGDVALVGLDISPAMLEVAKEVAKREGIRVDWIEGSAEELPFDDAAFDLVCCQQGLQPLRDPVGALREMRRVLADGGRVVTSTWSAIERNPFDRAIAEAVERHLGSPAFHLPFALGDPQRLAELFRAAGFDEFEITDLRLDLRYPSADDFVELIVVGGAAAIPGFQELDRKAQMRLMDAVRRDIAPVAAEHTEGGALVVPSETTIVVSC